MKREVTKEEKELIANVKKLFGKKMKKGLTSREVAEAVLGEAGVGNVSKVAHILKDLVADEKNGLKYTQNPEGSKRPGLWSRADVEPKFEGAVKSHKSATKKAEEKPVAEAKAPKASKAVKDDEKAALVAELEGLTKQLIQRAADADVGALKKIIATAKKLVG